MGKTLAGHCEPAAPEDDGPGEQRDAPLRRPHGKGRGEAEPHHAGRQRFRPAPSCAESKRGRTPPFPPAGAASILHPRGEHDSNLLKLRYSMRLQSAIFDMDGTLLDSMPTWRELGPTFLREADIEATPGAAARPSHHDRPRSDSLPAGGMRTAEVPGGDHEPDHPPDGGIFTPLQVRPQSPVWKNFSPF